MKTRNKVVVLADWYEPGYKAGGPIRSVANFAGLLKDDLDISVITTDRDLGDAEPYPGIVADQWQHRDGIRVFYCSPASLRWGYLKDLLTGEAADHIYLNSMFSRYFTVYPLLMKQFGMLRTPLVLAPRGMLKASALARKRIKKSLFNHLMKWTGCYSGIRFQATDLSEVSEIRALVGSTAEIIQLGNIAVHPGPFHSAPAKVPGSLSLLHVGRIHPGKNLAMLLRLLQPLKGNITLTAVGPVEDRAYWETCKTLISSMPENIKVVHMEQLPHHEIQIITLNNHTFALLTEGENFGHAIVEALSCSRPVLISNRTPWKGLASDQAGWDHDLSDTGAITETLVRLVNFNQQEMESWSRGAWEYIQKFAQATDLKKEYIKLFS